MLIYNIVQSLAHMNLEMKVMINTNYYTKFVLCMNTHFTNGLENVRNLTITFLLHLHFTKKKKKSQHVRTETTLELFNLKTVQQDATYSVYYISVGSCTCFR